MHSDVIRLILSGEMDGGLDQIVAAVRLRRESMAAVRGASIAVGNRVRVTGNVRPKYLAGATGVVDSKDGQRIRVRLDRRYGKFGDVQPVGFYPGSVERIS
jgi:hypothetical protein